MRETTPIDLVKEWPELARGQSSSSGDVAWGLPVLLWYIATMLGPWSAVLLALFLAKGRLGYRRLALIVGVAGSTWCIAQGVSAYLGMSVAIIDLQMLRSLLNFGAGLIIYLLVRPVVRERYRVGVRTYVISTALIVLMIALTVLLPMRWMVFVGR